LGTNTVHLLVAEVTPRARGWRTVLATQRVTRLGEGVSATGALGDLPAARTAAVVVDYVARARAAGAARVAIVATSAVRDAANGRAFAADLERATGVAVRVISGEEEARLTLAGIVAGLGPLRGVAIAFDIGGGSTEYILTRDGALVTAASLRLGVVPLAERFAFPGPVEPVRYATLRAEVDAQLERELPAAIATARVDVLVGTAGTVTTLAALYPVVDMDEVAVLVLNHTFEPLHFTNARRAITLLLAGKAESVEGSPRVIRSPSRAFPLPAVIRLAVYIRKPFLDRVAFNKKNILRRDGYTCQYCNRRGERLTVDHVLPRSR